MNQLIHQIIEKQKIFFQTGQTLDLDFRIKQLKKLHEIINKSEGDILNALAKDLKKPYFEAYTTEIMLIKEETKYALRNIKKWTRPAKVKTPVSIAPGKSSIRPQPYGVVLNIAPWNYPFQLCFAPLVPILSAGNCAVIKPSEYSPRTSTLVARLVEENFPLEYCAVVRGDAGVTQELLREKWDFISFTGSPQVGRVIAESAAASLTPVLLELGGKSPCIVHHDTKIKTAARRIVWGKFSNAGQTCTAVDFVLAHKTVGQALVEAIESQIKAFYGENAKHNQDYARIINKKHFDRLTALFPGHPVICGGQYDESLLYISPTVMFPVSWKDPVMQKEIFGPILPVIEYDDIDDVIYQLQRGEHPLALYLFTKNKTIQKKIIGRITFGGGCINTTLMHTANNKLPFGGVGNSGLGRYHGKAGFDTFSYTKSILQKPTQIDFSFIYPPYKNKMKLAKILG